jgi:hypothetical protein
MTLAAGFPPQGFEDSPERGMQGDSPARSLLRNTVSQRDMVAQAPIRPKDHGPRELSYLGCPQARLEREQQHGAISHRMAPEACLAQSERDLLVVQYLCLSACHFEPF